ncbi:hypothetical protein LTR62_007379 [Meristemomyces frigidus]|uniref:Uncharacterized protein n=1 Tax=Meristemomyces frigidus TaxID=1508187 RepID=A0AAN7YMG5_9PEZI|nr:hypothetical protein LTR62_007379 [Meristemomyces frigidus]
MASAEVMPRPSQPKRKPFANWVKRITNPSKHKKNSVDKGKNNPYPESGPLRQRDESPASAQLSFVASPRPEDAESYNSSLPPHGHSGREEQNYSGNKSAAPTVATNPGTIHSDTGHSKAATSHTAGGALSSAGAGSTFSSPAPSERSLTTTLTTIQSQSPGNALANGHHHNTHSNNTNHTNGAMFSHQYPTSPGPSTLTASAIPRHVSETLPNTYNSATANNLLTDNASILTLASSSKRRRRSMDTDASVRAIPPSSVWGGSRESLPLSVLSGNMDISMRPTAINSGGLAQAERASIYSSQGVSAHALASERNSYYSGHKPATTAGGGKDMPSDGKSLRSITNLDARSQYDARSINEGKSQIGDVGSLRNYEGSVRSGLLGHGRNDSVPGSIGSPLVSPTGFRQASGGALGGRSGEGLSMREREDEQDRVNDRVEH